MTETLVSNIDGAFALRPIRIDVRNNCFINYAGTTFPNDPQAGCSMYLRRAAICGGLVLGGEGPLGIDVLDKNGDILETFTISRAGFEYLRRHLEFRRERDADEALTEGVA